MKYIITERQLSLIKEENILKIDFEFFNWDSLQKFLKRRKNPPYIIKGNLDLFSSEIESLGNLQSVGGFLDLGYCKNFTKLGKLKSVGSYLDLTKTNIESLGNLQSVGGNLYLMDTPLSEKTTEEEIRNIPNLTIKGEIYL